MNATIGFSQPQSQSNSVLSAFIQKRLKPKANGFPPRIYFTLRPADKTLKKTHDVSDQLFINKRELILETFQI